MKDGEADGGDGEGPGRARAGHRNLAAMRRDAMRKRVRVHTRLHMFHTRDFQI